MTTLKSCPHCGGPAKVLPKYGESPRDREYVAFCDMPYCHNGISRKTEAEAVEAWNTRVEVDE